MTSPSDDMPRDRMPVRIPTPDLLVALARGNERTAESAELRLQMRYSQGRAIYGENTDPEF